MPPRGGDESVWGQAIEGVYRELKRHDEDLFELHARIRQAELEAMRMTTEWKTSNRLVGLVIGFVSGIGGTVMGGFILWLLTRGN